MGRIPDFLIIGAGRSGTTYLWHLLRRHPNIYMPHLKEPRYFSHRYDLPEDWYLHLFKRAEPHQRTGEASTGYLTHAEAAGRICDHNPKTKLICVLRHPVHRAWSHYTRAIQTQGEARPFFEANTRNYIGGSQYARHISPYLEQSPRNQILVLRSSELFGYPLDTINRVEQFLSVEPRSNLPRPKRFNESRSPANPSIQRWMHQHLRSSVQATQRGKGKWIRTTCWTVLDGLNHTLSRKPLPALQEETGQRILSQLLPDIQNLEQLLGWDLTEWKSL